MTALHMAGGATAGVVVGTNLPAVLGYFQGPNAPVTQETQLVLLVGSLVYAAIYYLLTTTRTPKQITQVPNA